MDLFSLDSDILGALDRAVGGKLIVTTEFLTRVVCADHLDLMVGGVVGIGPPYLLHVHALAESKEIVLASVTIDIADDLDEEVLRAVLLVYTRCVIERAEREKRRFTLKGIEFEKKEVQNRSAIACQESRPGTPPLSRRRRMRP